MLPPESLPMPREWRDLLEELAPVSARRSTHRLFMVLACGLILADRGMVTGMAAAAGIARPDVSGISRGEVECIWLPFMPWLIVATATISAGRANRACGGHPRPAAASTASARVQDLDPGEQSRPIRQPPVRAGPDPAVDPAPQLTVARHIVPGDRRGGRVGARAGEQQRRVLRAAECLQQFGENAQAGPQLGPSPAAAELMEQLGEHPQRLVVAAEPDQGGDERDARDLGDLRGPAGLGLGHGEFEDLDRGRGILPQPDLAHRVRREGPGRSRVPHPRGRSRAVGAEPFGGEGAHDRQHPAPRPALLVRDLQQRRVRQPGQADRGRRAADVLGRAEVEVGREHRQPRQQLLLAAAEQGPGTAEYRPHAAVGARVGEHVEAATAASTPTGGTAPSSTTATGILSWAAISPSDSAASLVLPTSPMR